MKIGFTTVVAGALVGGVSAFAPSCNSATLSWSQLNLAVGETAPDFALVDQNGKTISRSQFKKPLVVFFYPSDSSPGCTVQAEQFNKRIDSLRKKFGAEVVGISGQDAKSKQKFASDLGLNFSILADNGDATRNTFKVPKAAFGLLPGRVTYVLDNKGVCRAVYQDLADAAGHAEFAEKALAEIKATSQQNKVAPKKPTFPFLK